MRQVRRLAKLEGGGGTTREIETSNVGGANSMSGYKGRSLISLGEKRHNTERITLEEHKRT